MKLTELNKKHDKHEYLDDGIEEIKNRALNRIDNVLIAFTMVWGATIILMALLLC